MAANDDSFQPASSGGIPGNPALNLATIEQPWLRLPGEPAKWFSRFEIYLSLGPERSVRMVFLKVRRVRKETAEVNKWQPPSADGYSTWGYGARRWAWKERAEAWDEYNRHNLSRRNQERRIEERETRLKIISQHLHIADSAMLAAQLDSLTVEQARQLLPTLVRFLRDVLELHRLNLEPLPIFDDHHFDTELIPFTADELGAAVKELRESKWWNVGSQGDRDNFSAIEGETKNDLSAIEGETKNEDKTT